MFLDVYSGRFIQNCYSLLIDAKNQGLSIDDVLDLITKETKRLGEDKEERTRKRSNKENALKVYAKSGSCPVHHDDLKLRPCGNGFFCPACHDDTFFKDD